MPPENGKRDGHVRILPIHVANKIAAGEVVERPASVVKELVENSIDAGARNIKISISGGGRKLISVLDDGSGMSRDDALMCLERQATSKILDVGDIERIDTLGFRGEAIPSIASVSRFTLTTRRRDSDEGSAIAVNAGTLAGVKAAGCPPGTLVEVRDLFCNIPARKKFLRSYPTEEGHVKNVFTVQALAHRDIAFSLWTDGREAYRLAAAKTLAERLKALFGENCLDRMVRVGDPDSVENAKTAARGGVAVAGYMQRPGTEAAAWREQYVFVNGRPATAMSIAYALRDAYPRRQGDARPAAILFIDLPPGQVDVNVHPAKREVRFRDNLAVKTAICAAVSAAFADGGSISPAAISPAPPTPRPVPQPMPVPAPEAEQAQPRPAPVFNKTAPAPLPLSRPQIPATPAPEPVQTVFTADPAATSSRPWKWFKFLAASESGYIIVETDSGLVTVHPQAARERIAYEALVRRDGSTCVESQTLLIPDTVHLPPADAANVRGALDELRGNGFSIEDFGGDVFKIDAVPTPAADVPAQTVLAAVAKSLSEPGAKKAGGSWKNDIVAKSIARSYAGMSRSIDAAGAQRLVAELAACRMPYVCPRGRPTMIFTSNRELARKFSRE